MKKIPENIKGYLFVLFIVLFCACATILTIKYPKIGYSTTYWKMYDKNLEYEKILNAEFGQTFESYNEYLVYKIKKGEKENGK